MGAVIQIADGTALTSAVSGNFPATCSFEISRIDAAGEARTRSR